MIYQRDVKLFMKRALHDSPSLQSEDVPVLKSDPEDNDRQVKLYMRLITEEYNETLDAYNAGDVVEVADGLADMVWVILGMASSLGINFEDVWNEVKRSNMSKFQNNIIIQDHDGKILKPIAFSKPDIASVIGV